MSYNGGKGNSYHKIINRMPPHRVYIEAFLGGGAVMRKKRPAALNIGLELDLAVLKSTAWNVLREQAAPEREIMALSFEAPAAAHVRNDDGALSSGVTMVATASWSEMDWEFRHEDALSFLLALNCRGDELVYLDPPYLIETRRNAKRLYRYEMRSAEEHRSLLQLILGLDCMVAISGYWSELYMDMLSGWRLASWTAQTRQGQATEWLWMNYPEPVRLHDYRYLGDTYRERDRIKRKKARWVAKLQQMPVQERYALLAAMEGVFGDA